MKRTSCLRLARLTVSTATASSLCGKGSEVCSVQYSPIEVVAIAVVSLLVSHYLVRDLQREERAKMETWAEALHTLNTADETTDLSLVLNVIQSNNTIPVIVVNSEGHIDDFRNIDDTLHIEAYARRMMQAGDTIRIGGQLVCYDESTMLKHLCRAYTCAHSKAALR